MMYLLYFFSTTSVRMGVCHCCNTMWIKHSRALESPGSGCSVVVCLLSMGNTLGSICRVSPKLLNHIIFQMFTTRIHSLYQCVTQTGTDRSCPWSPQQASGAQNRVGSFPTPCKHHHLTAEQILFCSSQPEVCRK